MINESSFTNFNMIDYPKPFSDENYLFLTKKLNTKDGMQGLCQAIISKLNNGFSEENLLKDCEIFISKAFNYKNCSSTMSNVNTILEMIKKELAVYKVFAALE